MATLLDWLRGVHQLLVIGLVFLLPFLEASTMIGILVPGETAILVGGVLASLGRVSVWWVLLAGAAGAILGDSVGYWVGARWGERVMKGRVGRWIGRRRWDKARRHLRRKGLAAITIGRFPPAVRTLVPIAAGTARMPYRRFLLGNVVGGVVWACASAGLGYAAGNAWRKLDHIHSIVMIGGGVLVVGVAIWLFISARRRPRRSAQPRSQQPG